MRSNSRGAAQQCFASRCSLLSRSRTTLFESWILSEMSTRSSSRFDTQAFAQGLCVLGVFGAHVYPPVPVLCSVLGMASPPAVPSARRVTSAYTRAGARGAAELTPPPQFGLWIRPLRPTCRYDSPHTTHGRRSFGNTSRDKLLEVALVAPPPLARGGLSITGE